MHTIHGLQDDITEEASHAAIHAACLDAESFHTRMQGGHYRPWVKPEGLLGTLSLIDRTARDNGRLSGKPFRDGNGNRVQPVLPNKFDYGLYQQIGAKISVPGPHSYAGPSFNLAA